MSLNKKRGAGSAETFAAHDNDMRQYNRDVAKSWSSWSNLFIYLFSKDDLVFLFCLEFKNNSRNTPSITQSYWFPVPFCRFILSESPCWITYWTWTEVPGSTDGTDTEIIGVALVKTNSTTVFQIRDAGSSANEKNAPPIKWQTSGWWLETPAAQL